MFSYRQIQRLEERLSIQIFERPSKIVRLTDDGKAFCDEAVALLAQLEDVAFSCATPRDILQVHPALRLELIATVLDRSTGQQRHQTPPHQRRALSFAAMLRSEAQPHFRTSIIATVSEWLGYR